MELDIIKPNDLRLGNLVWNEVQDIAVKVNVKIIAEQNYRYEAYKKTGKDLGLWTPIPISKSRLLDFGFEVCDLSICQYWIGIDEIGESYICVDINEGEDIVVSVFNFVGKAYSFVYADVYYIHQLQNLFHSITGYELERKKEKIS